MKSAIYLVLPLTLLVCKPESPTFAQESSPIGQEQAVAEIYKLGGTVQVDRNRPGQPVVSVSVPNQAVTDDWLVNLKGLTDLQWLDLSHTQVTDAGLGQLTELTKLRTLVLPPTRVTDAGLEHLKTLKNLQELSLGEQIKRSGRQRVRAKFGESGEVISVRISGATGSEAEHLRKLSKLQTLRLYGNFPQSQLVHLKELKNLRRLQLNDALITDAGLEQLSELTSLQTLVLPSSRVTDSGLVHLKKLTDLQMLQLGGDRITAAGKKDLEAALPDCKMIVFVQNSTAEARAAGTGKPSGPARAGTKLKPKVFSNDPAAAATEIPENQYAVGLDGENSYIASDIRYDGTHPVTVEAWVRPEDLSGHREVICNAQASGIVLGFYDGWCKFLVHDGKGYQQAVAARRVTTGEDLHLAGVFDGQRIALYMDGLQQGAGTPFEGLHKPSSLPFLISANPEPNLFPIKQFSGVIDEVRISSNVRYDENFIPRPRLTPDEYTMALYHFDEGSGSIARDSSGNRSDARIDEAWFVERNAAGTAYRPAPGALPPSARPRLSEIEVPLTEWREYTTPAIGDAGMSHLRELTDLQTLVLAGSRVTDAGLVHLKDVTSLQRLQLNGPGFTDAGLAHLQSLHNLNDLSLNATQVTDRGLARLKKLSKLRRLRLYNTSVTLEGIRQLQIALPKCEILHTAR